MEEETIQSLELLTIESVSGSPDSATPPDPWLNTWPLQHLGIIPFPDQPGPELGELKRITESIFIQPVELTLDYKYMKCPLVDCWSSQLVEDEDKSSHFLELPAQTKVNNSLTQSKWKNVSNDEYPLNRILVRQCYTEIADAIFDNCNANAEKLMQQMILSGTPGTGKSFFTRYFLWRLLHPDGIRIKTLPDAIVYSNDPISRKGWVYRQGHFYKSEDLAKWMASNECDEILDDKDAWLINDGVIPPEKPRCKILVITSPGNLTKDFRGAKVFYESSPFEIYFPTWSFEECAIAGALIHGIKKEDILQLKKRYIKYGGIPRFVIEWQQTKPSANPLGNAIVSADIHKAVNDLGSSEFDHSAVSGKIIHMVPSPDYRSFTYEWASTEIMEMCFARLFVVSKSKVSCLLNSGQGLHMGTLYGILFEPWVHRKIAEQGLAVRVRPLQSNTANKPCKRKFRSSNANEGQELKIPKQPVKRFFGYEEIDLEAYDIPNITNFPAVDSFSPDRGELFQVIAAEDHPIKASKLDLLKPYFQRYLSTGAKARLYFVVPPYRFQSFKAQKYVYPTSANTAAICQQPTAEAQLAEQALEPHDDGTDPNSSKSHRKTRAKKQTAFQNQSGLESNPVEMTVKEPDWLEQWVMEIDVNPLSEAIRQSATAAEKDPNKRPRTIIGRLVTLGGAFRRNSSKNEDPPTRVAEQ